ncbi:hypothetical protein [Kineococcus rhizosphaerae]|uniref:Uncharacterized protein n=1 Tax=Kineococcus rhizosphaerae TaxID=559628 RepID=A0A2T0RB11_9ACTN|nr:hypothetical protein [Kineococcus rhizosphaerae]PRY18358.1 hypothetical protein CLV37_101603 [Kineococcus rhizosphaerae]
MALPISHPHQRYSVSGYQETELPDGAVAWSVGLLRYGQSFGMATDHGRGGPVDWTFTDSTHGQEFLTAAAGLLPDAEHPADVLVEQLITIRQLNSLDQVAYCFDGDRFEESGGHRLAEPGRSFAEVRRELAAEHADRNPRIWDRSVSAMVPVTPEG